MLFWKRATLRSSLVVLTTVNGIDTSSPLVTSIGSLYST